MFGIPEWAIGVGAVLTLVYALRLVQARLMPAGYRRRAFSFRGEPSPDQEELQERIAELDDLKRRIGEMEERLDFAERLLAQRRESERLPP